MEDKKPNNPPAFAGHTYSGMTLRDYFAAQAMTAILANQQLFLKVLESSDKDKKGTDSVACNAYAVADEMLKQREI